MNPLLRTRVLHPYTLVFLNTAISNGGSVQSSTRIQAYDDLIRGLVACGVWNILDCLYMLAASDSPTSRTNLISPTLNFAGISGAPTFTVDRGWTSSSTSTNFLTTGYIPSTAGRNLTLNSASIFCWTVSGTPSGNACGVRTSSNTNTLSAGAAGTSVNCCCNDNSSGVGTTTNALKFSAGSRINSTGIDEWGFNASGDCQLLTNQQAIASQALAAFQVTICCLNSGGTGFNDGSGVTGACGWGGGISQASNLMPQLETQLHKYMRTVAGVA